MIRDARAGDSAPAPALRISGLTKRYGVNTVLTGVTFDVRPGEIVGLVGANGAGKSTLIKILSGVVAATSGTITVGGAEFRPTSPRDAARAGIATVHQETNAGLVPGTTVADNLTLDDLAPGGTTLLRTRGRTRAAARQIAAAAELAVPVDAPIDSLTASERQQVLIARALAHRPQLLILDEPTSSLSRRESEHLIASVRRLAASGVAVIFVSHTIAEVEELCDRVVVLRDGAVQRIFERPFAGHELVAEMLGAVAAGLTHTARPGGDVVLAARGVRTRPGAQPFDLDVRAGEIVGITGLVGAGKTELLEQLFGERPLVSGELRLLGAPFAPRTPHAAARAGVAFVAEERSEQGVVPTWSVRHHVSLPRLRHRQAAGLLAGRLERAAAESTIAAFGVVGGGEAAELTALSGGNQQKVLVGRWFDGRSRLAVLDEPFRGVDVGARADIVAQLREHAADVAVIVASSDPAEIVLVADRVIVIADGDVTGELAVGDVTVDQLSRLMAASPGTATEPESPR